MLLLLSLSMLYKNLQPSGMHVLQLILRILPGASHVLVAAPRIFLQLFEK